MYIFPLFNYFHDDQGLNFQVQSLKKLLENIRQSPNFQRRQKVTPITIADVTSAITIIILIVQLQKTFHDRTIVEKATNFLSDSRKPRNFFDCAISKLQRNNDRLSRLIEIVKF